MNNLIFILLFFTFFLVQAASEMQHHGNFLGCLGCDSCCGVVGGPPLSHIEILYLFCLLFFFVCLFVCVFVFCLFLKKGKYRFFCLEQLNNDVSSINLATEKSN